MGTGSMGYTHLQYLGLVAYFPLFLVLDRIHQNPQSSFKRKLGAMLLACLAMGMVAAPIGVHWMIHSIHVFGHMPWPVALVLTCLGYGLEVMLVLGFCFALPLFVIRRWGWWDLPLRLLFAWLMDSLYPRLFQWSFGGLTFIQTPWLSQLADVVGAWGLGFYSLGCNFLLLLLWRSYHAPERVPLRVVRGFVIGYLVLVVAGTLYGMFRGMSLETQSAEGASLHIAAVQPNFSLKNLASNPDLAYSNRVGNIGGLLQDSKQALAQFPPDSSVPRLVVWPESTYPFAFFKDAAGRRLVEQFARENQTSVLLTTIDWEVNAQQEYKFYGLSLLLGPDGQIRGRYNKIFLIPFGEYIPGASWFPAWRNFMKQMVPQISEFEQGSDHTVFSLSETHQLSGSICFDIFSPKITRNMVRNGADLVINLSNLAWFGKSNATKHMEMMIRWKAIENRVPLLYISNNGQTMFINPLGEQVSKALELFETGSLSKTIVLQQHFSFYREYKETLQLLIIVLLLGLSLLAHRRYHVFLPASLQASD